ncbi:MAG: Holliday junction resolvase RuvX [Clostridiales bacterium]|nr:Holliday junction resolvase RuvX [Clostridiales bacterium]
MSRILAVDYGDMRTGLAVSDPLGLLASAAGVVTGADPAQVADRVVAEAVQRGAAVILLGLPKNMNNTLGPRAEKTLAFAELLRARFDGEVVLRDERNTTVSATRMLNETDTRGKKRKAVIDALSAAVLLQDYLDSLR